MIKLAMIRIDRAIYSQHLESQMLLQVHDELVFEVRKNELERMEQLVRSEMQNALKLSVPIDVEIGSGSNWLEAH
jgi:DNA polymerase-1